MSPSAQPVRRSEMMADAEPASAHHITSPSAAADSSGTATAHASGTKAATSQQAGEKTLSWPQMVSHEPSMKIGEVVEQLKADFPALSVSKVRYLEAERLIRPHRVGNGYRQYSKADVERLRFALTAQRDEYLPLSVIRERLKERDAHGEPGPAAHLATLDGERVDGGSLSAAALAKRVDTSPARIKELTELGLLETDAEGQYLPGMQLIARQALALTALGVPLRNLRSLKQAADRDALLVTQTMKVHHKGQEGVQESKGREAAQALSALHEALLLQALSHSWEN